MMHMQLGALEVPNIYRGGTISDVIGISDIRSELWKKDPARQKYRALQSAVAGFSQVGGKSKKLVFCVDFSEFYPLTKYDTRAGKAFTFQGVLHSKAPKELTSEQLWKQIDLAVLHRLFFETTIPIVISNSHTHEMSLLGNKMREDTGRFGQIFSDIKQQKLTREQLERIRTHQKNEHEAKGPGALSEEHKEFMSLFLPNWSIDEVRKVTRDINSMSMLNLLANESNLKYFSSDENSIFSTISDHYEVPPEIEREFWKFMSSSLNQQKHKTLYNELEQILFPEKVSELDTGANKIDAMALADMHMLNSFLDQNSIPINFQMLTRSPVILELQACLPPGTLNVIIRHPAVAPELYDFSERQLNKAREMIMKISSAIADYDRSFQLLDKASDQKELDQRLAETLKNFTEFLVYSELVKDLKDGDTDSLREVISRSVSIDGDEKDKADAISEVEGFLNWIGDALLDEDSVIMQDANFHHNAIEKRAANARLSGRFLGIGRDVKVFCTKQKIDYRISGLESHKIKSYMLSAPVGYMSPVFHLFDSELASFFQTSKPQKLFHLAKISEEAELTKVRKNLNQYERTLQKKYAFLTPREIKKYLIVLRNKKGDQPSALQNLFGLESLPQNKEKVDEYHSLFESALIKYLSIFQARAYYYAVFMQYRYAGILSSEALRVLMGSTDEQCYDIDLFQNLGPFIKDKRIFLCFKELFILRQYCERAHGFDLNFKRKNSSNMAEVILQQDKPFIHFSRADRDLHFANLCHRLAATGNINEAVDNQLEDARLALTRHAGYQENLLKGMMATKSEAELLSRVRNLFWTSASNGRSLDKLAQSLISSLNPENSNRSECNYSNEIWGIYTRYQISRAYHINLTSFLVFMSEKNVHQLDAYWDPFKPLLHVNILGFVQIFYWKSQLEKYLNDTGDASPFSTKTKSVLIEFIGNIKEVDDLRRTMLDCEEEERDGETLNSDTVSQKDYITRYTSILLDIYSSFNKFLSAGEGKDRHIAARKNSFYWTLITRLQRRTVERLESYGNELEQH